MSIAAGAFGDSVLVFDVGSPAQPAKAAFGLEVLYVRRVIEIEMLAPVPLAPLVVKGIINDKGRIVTIIDPAPLLGLSPQPGPPVHGIILKQTAPSQGTLGLEAVRVRGIVPSGELEEVDIDAAQCTQRVAKLEHRLVHVIDVELLHKELRLQFGSSAGGHTRQGEQI